MFLDLIECDSEVWVLHKNRCQQASHKSRNASRVLSLALYYVFVYLLGAFRMEWSFSVHIEVI